MKFKIQHSPLDKGEKWEKKGIREIEICKSGDNRGAKPTIYFGIYKGEKLNIIHQDFFLPTETAVQIANAILETVKNIETQHIVVKPIRRRSC